MSDITVLGTGLMGSAIARAFAGSGHKTTVWNRTASKATPLEQHGISVADSCESAIGASELTVSVLVDCAALRSSLPDDVDLGGRTIVNLSTATPSDANETARWTHDRGGRYLHGTIAAYPKDIGTPGGGVVYSGPSDLWEQYGEVLLLLGGESNYAGENVADACTLDLAMLTYYMGAEAAFQEALAYAEAYGVSPQRLIKHVMPTHTILARVLQESVEAVVRGDFSTTEATNDTFLACMELASRSQAEAGMDGAIVPAARELYGRAVTAGRGKEVPAALVEILRPNR